MLIKNNKIFVFNLLLIKTIFQFKTKIYKFRCHQLIKKQKTILLIFKLRIGYQQIFQNTSKVNT